MTQEKTITFIIDSKKILNSNSMPHNWFVKSSKASFLRNYAGIIGVEHHTDQHLAQIIFDHNKEFNDFINKKSSFIKKLKKESLTDQEYEKELLAFQKNNPIPEKYDYTPLFHHFIVDVIVYSPTARRIDPVNLYPSVKPLIDGLTDCGWWADDDSQHLQKISFSYGGISEEKKHFIIILRIKEIEGEGK